MTEILEDNNFLEQDLRTHYQQEYGPLLTSAEMWTRVSPLLKQHPQAQSWNRRLLAALRTLSSSSGSLERPGSPRGGIRVPRPVTIMMASMACFIVLSGFAFAALGFGPRLQLLFNFDPATKQLALAQLFTQYNQTQKVDGHTITLSAAYADANNVIVGYQSDLPLRSSNKITQVIISNSGNSGNNPNQDSLVPYARLSTTNGQPLGHISEMAIIGALQKELNAQLSTFDGSTIKGNPHSLTLTLTLLYTKQTTLHKVTFHFTVPFHPGRVLPLHQSVFAHGETLTLDHAVITPSETRFYLSGDTTFQNQWKKTVFQLPPSISSSLQVGKQLYYSYMLDSIPVQRLYYSYMLDPKLAHMNNAYLLAEQKQGDIPTSPANMKLPYILPAGAQHGDRTLTVQVSFPDCSNKNTAPYCTSSPPGNNGSTQPVYSPAETWTFHIHA